jgi:AcrR family transcriptional regulator
MPRTSERGGPQTRERIREAASLLFLQRGYDAVTVAEVASAAGVSSVTVFNHFPRKEDLFFDRTTDAVELLQSAIRDRESGVDPLTALQTMSVRLFDERAPLSGVDPRSDQFFRTVAGSPALVARAREIAAELQGVLADELEKDSTFTGDAPLLAALFVAGYSVLFVTTARQVLNVERGDSMLNDHRQRLDRLFAALRGGLPLG